MSGEQTQHEQQIVMLSPPEYEAELTMAYLQGFKAGIEATQRAYEEVQKSIAGINKTGF